MNAFNARNAMQQYGSVGTQSEVAFATPHKLIQMLMRAALEKIAVAKGHMARKETAQKGNYISWAISIIEGLRISLDSKEGGEIAANLEALYDYMQRRLVTANANNDPEMLDEVSGLLRKIREAWDAIPESVQQEHMKNSEPMTVDTPNVAGKL